MAFYRIIALPKSPATVCVDAEDAAFLAVGMVTHEIKPFPPQYWRATAYDWQVYLPVVVIGSPFDGEIGCRADARTIGATKARPFLGQGLNAWKQHG